jgi:hypothetical protein
MTPFALFSYFGNRKAASRALGTNITTVRYWEKIGRIPDPRQWQIELATNHDLRADRPALVDPQYQLLGGAHRTFPRWTPRRRPAPAGPCST